jgi:UDP-glucose 4-epimerase
MRILITGGKGYVASELCNFFLALPECFIRVASRGGPSHDNIFQNHGIEQVSVDWSNRTNLLDICNGVDIVMHAAGMDSESCKRDWVEAYQINGVGTANLVDAAMKTGVKHFFYYSTAHVYKKNLNGKITEEECPLNLHPYAISHLIGERALLYASSISKMNGYVFRVSNAFGLPLYYDSAAWGLLINDISRQASLNKEIHLKSDGYQYRNFIPVGEIPLATNHLLTFYKNENKVLSDVFNLGGEMTASVNEVANLVAQICKEVKGYLPLIHKINNVGQIQFQSQNLIYDCSKIKATGYTLTLNPIDIIRNVIAKRYKACK